MGIDCCTVAEDTEQSPGIRVGPQPALRSQTINEDGVNLLESIDLQRN